MRVLFATAELAPLVRVGGLAEAASGLVRELRSTGLVVDVVLPDYFGTPLDAQESRVLEVPEWAGPASARRGLLAGFGDITLIDVPDIRRPHPYAGPGNAWGWPDNDQRFIRFSVACAELARVGGADVLHANDWHTAASFAFCDPQLATVFSIHNLAYQGQCDLGWLQVFGSRAESYSHGGACNPMAGALRVADRVIAVSPTYTREILTPEHGNGLDEVLASRGPALIGIRNGIDTSEWSPSADDHIARQYSLADVRAGKNANRKALRERFELPVSKGPVVGMVTRLVHQKGVDLVLDAAPYLASVDAQLVVLGTGDLELADGLQSLASVMPDRVAFFNGYDIALSHLVFAGADLYLMPSRFEPCGLAQMQAMAYGSIPIVTDVGGLHDTVIDVDVDGESGTGLVTARAEPAGIVDALHRAARLYRSTRARAALVERGMTIDWSWTVPASEYLATYRQLTA